MAAVALETPFHEVASAALRWGITNVEYMQLYTRVFRYVSSVNSNGWRDPRAVAAFHAEYREARDRVADDPQAAERFEHLTAHYRRVFTASA